MGRPKKAFRADIVLNDRPSLPSDHTAKNELLRDFPPESQDQIAARIEELVGEALHKANAPSARDIAHTVNGILDAIGELKRQMQSAHPAIFGGIIGVAVEKGLTNFNMVLDALEVQQRTFDGRVNRKGGRRKSPLTTLQKPLEELYQELMPLDSTLNKKTNARPFANAVIDYYKRKERKG